MTVPMLASLTPAELHLTRHAAAGAAWRAHIEGRSGTAAHWRAVAAAVVRELARRGPTATGANDAAEYVVAVYRACALRRAHDRRKRARRRRERRGGRSEN